MQEPLEKSLGRHPGLQAMEYEMQHILHTWQRRQRCSLSTPVPLAFFTGTSKITLLITSTASGLIVRR